MAFQHIKLPTDGQLITVENDHLAVADNPIVGFIEGDGIGPDITRACLRVWDAAVAHAYNESRKVHWCEVYAGEKAAAIYDGDYFPQETIDALQHLMVSIKGPLTTPVGGGFRSLNVAIRQELDLYACVRPVRYYTGVPSPLRNPENVDVVIFRENTEDVYSGIEFESGTPEMRKVEKFLREEMGARMFEDSGIGIKPISPFGSKRLIRKAIRYAIDNERESVTLVHKGNIMKYTEGAFRNWGYELVRDEFKDQVITEEALYSKFGGKQPEGKIVIKDRIADIIFQLMLLRPAEFDVLATMNLNGDYLSDAVAAEVGGVGIAPGANMADHVAVFEATHGTAPKYANQDKVNPGSLLFSGVMLLEYIGWKEAAQMITAAYTKVIGKKVVTYDFARQMDGATEVSTSKFADALIEEIAEAGAELRKLEIDRDRQREEARKAREQRRMSQPLEEMLASGRRPHTVGHLMRRRNLICSADDTVAGATRMLRQEGGSSLLVAPGADDEWGILTQTDILKRIIVPDKSPAHTKVSEVCTKPLKTLPIETSLRECARFLVENNIRRVVVMSQNEPVGIVSDTDLFDAVDEFGWGHE